MIEHRENGTREEIEEEEGTRKKREGETEGGCWHSNKMRGDSSQRNIVYELGFSIRSAGMHQK